MVLAPPEPDSSRAAEARAALSDLTAAPCDLPVPSRRGSRTLQALPAVAAAGALLATTVLLLESRDLALRTDERSARAPEEALARPPATSTPPRAGTGPAGGLLAPPTFAIFPGDGSGATFCLEGSAPGARTVMALVDGLVAATATVTADRFALSDVEVPGGDHVLSVAAIDAAGRTVESEPQRFRYTGAEPVVAPRPSGAPRATPATTPPVLASLVTPTPVVRAPREAVPRSDERGLNIVRGPDDRIIALTFDGGSDAGSAYDVLDALRAKGVHSTLFLTGDFIRLYPDVTRRIVADGHEVGNHTFTHPHLADWLPPRGHVTRKDASRELLVDELERTRAIFESTTGTRMSRYWRAPYGEVNREIIGWAERAGWIHVGWTEGLDTLDWVADPSDRRYRSAPEIRDRLLAAARRNTSARGGIVLMHLGHERTVDDVPSAELPRIIDGLRHEGYRIVTVSALVGG